MNRLLPIALLLVAAAAAYLLLAPAGEPGPSNSVGGVAAEGASDQRAGGQLEGAAGAAGADLADVERAEAGDEGMAGSGLAARGAARVQVRFVDAQGKAVRDLEVRAEEGRSMGGFGFRVSMGGDEADGPGVVPDAAGLAVLEVPPGEDLILRSSGDYWVPVEIPLQPLRPGETLDVGTRTLTPAARVHGTVLGADGAPLEGAQVMLRSESGFGFGPDMARLRATTDADGSYAIGGVRAGDYALDVDGPGHARESLPGFLVPAGGGDLLEDFRLQPGQRAFGIVVDQDRNPIAGAELRVQQGGFGFLMVSGPDGTPRTPPGAVSASDGRFALDGLSADGEARVLATAEGYAPTSERFTGEADELVLEMRRQVDFSGTLLDQDGRPAAGVEMRLRPLSREDWRFWLRDQEITTEADGSFAFRGLAPGRYAVEASTPTAALGGIEQQLDVDTAAVELRMRQVPVLVVRVTDDSGAAVQGARVSVRPQQRGVRGSSIALGEFGDLVLEDFDGSSMAVGGTERTDAQGRAWFPELGEGIYDLTVRADGKADLRRPLTRARGPQTEVVTLLPGADLRVQVVDADANPVEGVNVVLEEAAGGRERRRVSDVAGRAWWDGLAPGRYVARAEAGHGGTGIAFMSAAVADQEPEAAPEGELVEIAAGDHADLVLTVESLALPEVLVTRGGEPVAGAEARLEPKQEDASSFGPGLFMPGQGRTTGPDGRVQLAPAGPGDYVLWVRATPSSPESSQDVTLSAGAVTLEFRVEGATVSGRLVDLQGPLAGARVSLERDRGEADGTANQVMIFSVSVSGPGGDVVSMSGGSPMASVRSDERGQYRFVDVPAGDWRVVARARGYTEWRSEPITVSGSGQVDAGIGRLEAGGRIEGSVPDSGSGGFSRGGLIQLRSEDGKSRDVTVPRDGRYVFQDVTPGRYILEYKDEESPVLEVDAGRTTTWNW